MSPAILSLVAFCFQAGFTGLNAATVSSIAVNNNKATTKGSDVQIVCSMTGFSSGVVYISKTGSSTPPENIDATKETFCDKSFCLPGVNGRYSFSSNVNEVTINIQSLDRLADQNYWHCLTQGGSHKALRITVYTPPSSLSYTKVPAQSQDLATGSVTLTCETDCSYPQPLLKWLYTDGSGSSEYSPGTVSSSSDCTVQEKKFSYSLTLSQYTTFTNNEDKTVKFKCGISAVPAQGLLSPLYSPESPDITFAVEAGTPEIKNKPSDALLSGDDVSFVCQTTLTRPAASVTWKKGGVQITRVSNSETTSQDGRITVTSTVTFTPVQADHQKYIVCETAIPGQSSATEDRTQVTVWWPPSAPTVTASPAFPWREGQTDNYLLCGATNMGNPSSSETWTSLSGSKQPDGRLQYVSLTSSHDDEAVTCELENAYTQRKNIELVSQEVHLDVQYKPIVTVSVNNIERGNITVNEGQSLQAMCTARGNPSPTVEWLGQTTNPAGNLSFQDIDRTDDKTYTCRAMATSALYPGYGTTEKMLNIGVNYAPTVTVTHSNEQGRLQFSCNAVGKPRMYTYRGFIHSWRGQQLQDLRQLNRQVLDIPSPQLEDSGNYTCHVDNGIVDREGQLIQTSSNEILIEGQPEVLSKENMFVGKLSESSNVTVQFYSHPAHQPVKIKRDDVTLSNTNTITVVALAAEIPAVFYGKMVFLVGTSVTLKIKNLTETDFSNYTLEVTNNQGTVIWPFSIVSQSAPVTPKSFKFVESSNQISFYWEKGFNGGHKQFFIIETSVDGSVDWVQRLNISEDNKVNDLKNGSYKAHLSANLPPGTYSARLYAVNKINKSDSIELETSFKVKNAAKKITTSNAPLIAGVAVGSGVAVIGIVVIVVFVMKKRNTPQRKSSKAKKGKDNEVFVPEIVENGQYVPFVPNTPSGGVKGDCTYSEVNKFRTAPLAKSNLTAEGNPEDLYATPNKAKGNANKTSEDRDGENNTDVQDLYASPIKKTDRKAVSKAPEKEKKAKGGKKKKGGKGKGTATQGDVYENEDMNILNEKQYANSPAVKETQIYEDVGGSAPQQPQRQVNQDGLIYLDLDFKKDPRKATENKIIGIEDKTEYGVIDFNKKADPLPDSDEEDKNAK